MEQPNQVPTETNVALSISGLAVAAMVIGIIAILTSIIPIINNGSAILAIAGFILALIGFSGIKKGKKKGKNIAIAGIVLNVIAFIVVIATQMLFVSAIDSATNPKATVSSSASSGAADSSKNSTQDLAIGTPITIGAGLEVKVDKVTPNLSNYDGSAITGITVTYTNTGKDEANFNVYDWKAQDGAGAQRNMTFYSKAKNDLSSGSLAPGGTVTGNVYFEGDAAKALYYGSMLADEPAASWNLK